MEVQQEAIEGVFRGANATVFFPQAALEEKAADIYTNAVEHYRHQRFSDVPRQD